MFYQYCNLFHYQGWMEYTEIEQTWQQKSLILAHWKPSQEPKPSSFVGKFLEGKE